MRTSLRTNFKTCFSMRTSVRTNFFKQSEKLTFTNMCSRKTCRNHAVMKVRFCEVQTVKSFMWTSFYRAGNWTVFIFHRIVSQMPLLDSKSERAAFWMSTIVNSMAESNLVVILGFWTERKIALCFGTTTRAHARDASNMVLAFKIPIELQCDYSGGLLLKIAWT